jgi:predicted outer membrane lipoprotein
MTEILVKKGHFTNFVNKIKAKIQLDQKITIQEKIMYEWVECHFCSGTQTTLSLALFSLIIGLELAFWLVILAVPFGLVIGLFYEIVEALQRSGKE